MTPENPEHPMNVEGVAIAHAYPFFAEAESSRPLEDLDADEFWTHPPQSVHVRSQAVEHAPYALLRRLGPSPLAGRFPMVGLLASVYDRVSAASTRWRDELPDERLNPVD